MSTRQAEPRGIYSAAPRLAPVTTAKFSTPWGEGGIAVADGRLVGVELPPVADTRDAQGARAAEPEDQRALRQWVVDLEGYFRGEKLSWEVSDIAFHLEGMAPFARRTIEALMSVPEGRTVSYGELAEMAGHPRAARAVGSVMACNHIPIVIPCHRVIRSDGTLGRYGTDVSWKERLLNHERRSAADG